MTEAQALEKIQGICDNSNGRSQVFHPGTNGYLSCIRHYFASSTQDASFSVEPGSAEDLSEIMKVIKDSDSEVSFAVKGGGHTSNPTFSSTKGIQICMSRFAKISHDEAKSQLTVGAGYVFDKIYEVIRPKNYNIIGGGGDVGLGGWIMGGGYSLKTNQYGLGIDNLVQVQIVLPDGKVVKAAENINSDLFWAIKGGGNNFGIVTEFVLKTHPQGTDGHCHRGVLTFDKPHVERVKGAIVNFMKREDPKAAIVAAFRFYRNQDNHESKLTVLAFYDDEQLKPDAFEEFLVIPHGGEIGKSFNTRLPVDTARTFLYHHIPAHIATTWILSSPETDGPNLFSPASSEIPGRGVMNARARWGNVMVSKYTQNLINAVEEEAKAAEQLMEKYNGKLVVTDIWPFLPTMFDKSVDSAWPHKKGVPNGPLLVYFMWEDEENDEKWIDQMKTALRHIHDIALQEKCTTDVAPVYCNTTLEDVTSPEQIYRHNLADLSALRAKYDPNDVMGRTGGFRIPFGHAIVNGTYNITNTKDNDVIGVKDWEESEIPVVKSDGTTANRFNISSGDGKAYTISIESDNGSEDRIIAQHTREKVVCMRSPRPITDTWKIIPESRRKNQLEYSIVDQEGTKRWVLDRTQVKCIAVVDGPVPDNALWCFKQALAC